MSSSLDKNERYLVSYYQSDRASGIRWAWLAAQCFAAVIFGYGFANDDKAMIFTGFGTLFFLDLYSMVRQPRISRLHGSTFSKLEQRIEELECQQQPR